MESWNEGLARIRAVRPGKVFFTPAVLLTAAWVAASLPAQAAVPVSRVPAAVKIDQLASPATLKSELEKFISISRPNRSVGSKGHLAAYEYLKTEFKKIRDQAGGALYEHGFEPDIDFAVKHYENDFAEQVEGKIPRENPDYRKWKDFTASSIAYVKSYEGKPGKNLVLEIPGTKSPKDVIYIGAHYDTITHDHETLKFTPKQPTDGADDNASGVVALLQMARAVAEKGKPSKTIRFVAFDYEEVFFLGAYALAKDLKSGKMQWSGSQAGQGNFKGLYVLEMIGWSSQPPAKKPTFKIYTRTPEGDVGGKDLALAGKVQEAAAASKTQAQAKVFRNGFNRSDHWSFWQKGFPAVCVTQDWEKDFHDKHYHTSQDKVANLNLPYMSEITRAMIQLIISEAYE